MVKKNNLRKKDKYYKKKALIDKTMNSFLRKSKGILYGSRAVNYYTPSHLDVVPKDYDIFSKTPKKSAHKVEKKLDKKFKGDYFYTKKGVYPRTWKVKSNVTDRTVVDFTKPTEKIPFNKRQGIRYAKLAYLKRKYYEILRDKTQEFRWQKTKEALQRIKIYERLY
jgi:hypothetical protein